jgi:hypothetical protein
VPYTKVHADWKDYPDVTTPVTAAALEQIEQGIFDAYALGEDAIDSDIVDAKGDLIVASAADTVTRKAVGANDEVLVADSAQSTGVKWAKVGNAMVASDAAIAVSKLAAGSDDQFLKTVAGVPSWAAIASFATYTPTWTADTTNPVIGNGTITGRYVQIGKLTFFSFKILAGSTTTFGTGTYSVGLPTTAATPSSSVIGGANVLDAAVANWASTLVVSSTQSILVLMPGAGNAVWNQTVPFTFANGDSIQGSGVYEAS